jgi:hypothetical protein
MIEFIKFLYDFFIPHFVVEDVALIGNDDDFVIMCCMNDVVYDDIYDGVATSKALVWLFWGFNATVYDFRWKK